MDKKKAPKGSEDEEIYRKTMFINNIGNIVILAMAILIQITIE